MKNIDNDRVVFSWLDCLRDSYNRMHCLWEEVNGYITGDDDDDELMNFANDICSTTSDLYESIMYLRKHI